MLDRPASQWDKFRTSIQPSGTEVEMSNALIVPIVAVAFWQFFQAMALATGRISLWLTRKLNFTTTTPGTPHGPPWYWNLNRINVNMLESLTLFMPAAILCLFLGITSPLASTLAWIYLGSRIIYAIVYGIGGYKLPIPMIWTVGVACTLGLWVLVAQRALALV
ncbi:MAG: MAPEG family protein [Deltaproteobacteria bacterium]